MPHFFQSISQFTITSSEIQSPSGSHKGLSGSTHKIDQLKAETIFGGNLKVQVINAQSKYSTREFHV
jgi:hypothetical protein